MMKPVLFATLSLILGTSSSQAAALVKKDQLKKVLTVISHINYHGSAATVELADASSNEISRMWNRSGQKVLVDGVSYAVQFLISYSLNDMERISKMSDSCAENFVEILPKTLPNDRSFFYGLGGKIGVFYTSDGLGKSTTTAHEFGHGYGLDHDDPDQLSAQEPGIMFARGTLVKPQYQWDPNAQPGEKGGTLNPVYRVVRGLDIQNLSLDRLNFVQITKQAGVSFACLGQGTLTPVTLGKIAK